MKKLEEELGVSLFSRRKNRLALNETGLRAAEYARHVLEENEEFAIRVRAYDRGLRTVSIGFCAPTPQIALLPVLNSAFSGMAISSEIADDSDFLSRLKEGVYQLAVVHNQPEDDAFFFKKCGHEDLFVSLMPGHPLASRPEIQLKDMDGMSILRNSNIGFWEGVYQSRIPNAHYLIQIDVDFSFAKFANEVFFPAFSSSYHLRRGVTRPGRVYIPVSDPESHADYYLVCLREERKRYRSLFDAVTESTVR